MSDSKEMKTQGKREMQSKTESENFIRPAVDIYEDGNEITVKADLPGVSRDRLNIQIDGNNLAIEAQAAISMPEGMEALYADLKTTRFLPRCGEGQSAGTGAGLS